MKDGWICGGRGIPAVAGAAFAADGDQFSSEGDATNVMLEQHLNSPPPRRCASRWPKPKRKGQSEASPSSTSSASRSTLSLDGRGKRESRRHFQGQDQRLTHAPSRVGTANAVARGASELRQWTFGKFAKAADCQLWQWTNNLSAIGVGGRMGARLDR